MSSTVCKVVAALSSTVLSAGLMEIYCLDMTSSMGALLSICAIRSVHASLVFSLVSVSGLRLCLNSMLVTDLP